MTALYTETFFSDICEEIRLFIDTRRIEQLETDEPLCEGFCVLHRSHEMDGVATSRASVCKDGKAVSEYEYSCPLGEGALGQKRNAKRAAKISVYRALSKLFETSMPWGSLTGIRPTKLLRDSEARLGTEGARALFLHEFDVSKEKYDFAKCIVDVQKPYFPADNDVDIFIGIPFCTTRCAYCSFASNVPGVFKGAEEQYVAALLRELSDIGLRLNGRRVRSVYVGGGTPTALNDKNFETVLSRAAEIAAGADEFTVEAGRPDTITEEKLSIIKDAGAGRVSVNPQTLNNSTLERIGRRHTAQDFIRAYGMARDKGFVINVDVIVGLPDEKLEDVMATLESVISLSPENITVHTLAVKRASKFAETNMGAFPGDNETALMVGDAAKLIKAAGYNPYYMYRQKYMKGSLENAGYARPGYECLYNIDNMEELLSVEAFGAGAISKLVINHGERIERSANTKDLRLYIGVPKKS
jgi:oxygen-independent coproporphyrinogen-3 oxidase